MTVRRCASVAAIVFGGLVSIGEAQGPSGDWLQWRGPNRDGAITSFTAPQQWPETLVERWKVEVGLGYATPLVAGNRVYMFSRQGDNEVMSALDAGSGKVLWQTGYPAMFTMQSAAAVHGPGPKSTPTLAGGKLYAIGMTGIVTAFDAATGKQLWQKPPSKVPMFYTSHAFSPLVDRGLVVFHVGATTRRADGIRREYGRREMGWNGAVRDTGRRNPPIWAVTSIMRHAGVSSSASMPRYAPVGAPVRPVTTRTGSPTCMRADDHRFRQCGQPAPG